jgi:hypothetical protein
MKLLILFVILFIPLIFQATYGSKNAYRVVIKRFWIITSISILSHLLVTISGCYLMIRILQEKEIRDGLPIAGVISLGIFIGIILLLVVTFQIFKLLKDRN